jgi:hypothetical protein
VLRGAALLGIARKVITFGYEDNGYNLVMSRLCSSSMKGCI